MKSSKPPNSYDQYLALKEKREKIRAQIISLRAELTEVEVQASKALVDFRGTFDCDFKLTQQEMRVIGLVRQGLPNKQIAGEINISERTVKFHVSNLLKKHNVPERCQL